MTHPLFSFTLNFFSLSFLTITLFTFPQKPLFSNPEKPILARATKDSPSTLYRWHSASHLNRDISHLEQDIYQTQLGGKPITRAFDWMFDTIKLTFTWSHPITSRALNQYEKYGEILLQFNVKPGARTLELHSYYGSNAIGKPSSSSWTHEDVKLQLEKLAGHKLPTNQSIVSYIKTFDLILHKSSGTTDKPGIKEYLIINPSIIESIDLNPLKTSQIISNEIQHLEDVDFNYPNHQHYSRPNFANDDTHHFRHGLFSSAQRPKLLKLLSSSNRQNLTVATPIPYQTNSPFHAIVQELDQAANNLSEDLFMTSQITRIEYAIERWKELLRTPQWKQETNQHIQTRMKNSTTTPLQALAYLCAAPNLLPLEQVIDTFFKTLMQVPQHDFHFIIAAETYITQWMQTWKTQPVGLQQTFVQLILERLWPFLSAKNNLPYTDRLISSLAGFFSTRGNSSPSFSLNQLDMWANNNERKASLLLIKLRVKTISNSEFISLLSIAIDDLNSSIKDQPNSANIKNVILLRNALFYLDDHLKIIDEMNKEMILKLNKQINDLKTHELIVLRVLNKIEVPLAERLKAFHQKKSLLCLRSP